MTSKERIVAALEGRPVDHVPFSPFLAYVWEHFPAEVQAAGPLAFLQRIGADPLWRGAPCPVQCIAPEGVRQRVFEEQGRRVCVTETPVGALRQAYALSETGNTDFLVEHPLKAEEDYKVQLWIEEHARPVLDTRAVDEHFAGPGREGLSLGMLIPRGKSAFQFMVEHLVGTEELVYALADFPDTVESLWRTMVAKDLEAVTLALQSDYDHFITWEDSSTQNYSPSQYDAYIGTEIGSWCRLLAAHEKRYVQHACGHLKALMGRMMGHGVFAVESLSPPPTGNLALADARKIAGSAVGLIGGIEPTEFLRLPPELLGTYVEQVIAEGCGGPFVLANSDSCPPGVTEAKFKLAADVARSVKNPAMR